MVSLGRRISLWVEDMHCFLKEEKRRILRRLDHCTLAKTGVLLQGRVPALLDRATNDTRITSRVLLCNFYIQYMVFNKGQMT